MAKFLPAVTLVLKHEGGLSNNKDDEGGITNHGISLRFYKTIKPDATVWDIESLSMTEAESLYERKFWDPMRLEEVDSQHLANRLLDLGVNTGMREASLLLQRAINYLKPKLLKEDGIIGIRTLAAANGAPQQALYDQLILEATKYYNQISKIAHNHQFLDGWLHRLTDTP